MNFGFLIFRVFDFHFRFSFLISVVISISDFYNFKLGSNSFQISEFGFQILNFDFDYRKFFEFHFFLS